ncbi:aromatic amino acid ammonia-lyase [Streptomonospora nanhaiensis]|uniref:Histidine ammonia-lyase n=1 Tax=Streptomonospora nanhaiensis TaxID=1323731 RepID=A0A853BQN3_9ACTN|nr:aromatic amino acid ammonia-lyase [Streptomonospora nanhaiensis]MBX9388681.1 aromatic amino acid ammonia-lyase [Streptomonospora nanhaiensis]NYI97035.1 histidine ammonia-lyase [Streptomonospora nanhaiensis]
MTPAHRPHDHTFAVSTDDRKRLFMTMTPQARTTTAELGFPAILTPEALETAADPVLVRLDEGARTAVARCHDYLHRCLAEGREIYGATTGFGPLVGFSGRDEAADQCENLLCHLDVGQGADLPPGVARAALLARLWSLAHGRSGVALEVVDALSATLATPFAPAVPEYGSVGASGDLAPMAHAVRSLQGRGDAYLGAVRMPAGRALAEAGLQPLSLSGRDALGLVNGTPVTAAAAGLALAALTRSLASATALTALLADILGCRTEFAAPELFTALGHDDTARQAADLRAHLAGHRPGGERALQEPYTLRCAPHLIGAAATSLRHARRVVTDDLNGVSDNPLFIPERDLIRHGGNFFGQQAAFAADLMSITAAQLGNLAERQLDLLIDPRRNGGLNPMLAEQPGRDHGVQGVQLAATSLVVAMRRAAVPAAMQSIPTNHHNQDVVPFGTQAAITALEQARTLRLLHGSLAVALAQAARVGARRPSAPRCAELLDALDTAVAAGSTWAQAVRTTADLLDTWEPLEPSAEAGQPWAAEAGGRPAGG